MTRITERRYRGHDSVVIATNELEAVFFTRYGAKMVSLRNLRNGYEFLWQGRQDSHPEAAYGTLYVDNDLCGADDVFPSINSSYYPDPPWRGTLCPPHGELWSLPWTTEIVGSTLVFRCRGVRLPYEIERSVAFSSPTHLQFNYRLSNSSPYPMAGIWAFHPLFNAGNDTRIVLPRGTVLVENTLDFKNRLGQVGSVHSWPMTIDKFGQNYDLSGFDTDCGICEKFFVNGPLSEGRCRLERAESGKTVEILFPTETVGYLGIWKNQGGLLDQNNIAVEPATGSFDDIYIARGLDKCAVLPPEGTWEYRVEFEVR